MIYLVPFFTFVIYEIPDTVMFITYLMNPQLKNKGYTLNYICFFVTVNLLLIRRFTDSRN